MSWSKYGCYDAVSFDADVGMSMDLSVGCVF